MKPPRIIDPLILLVLLGFAACHATPQPSAPREPAGLDITTAVGDEIIVCGKRFSTGAPVVLWFEEPFYSAYALEARFEQPEAGAEGVGPLRYQPGRTIRDSAVVASVSDQGWTLANLRRVVDQFILHYDVCGTSQVCFRVLHDRRGLSVHFLLDVDGTIYQTLDLKEQAWHARSSNPRSIGIEIAQIGAYAVDGPNPFDEWYVPDGEHTALSIPARLGDGGVRTPAYQGRTLRPDRIEASLQGHRYTQFDFTEEQYDSLIKLTAALVQVFPRIEPDAPRDASGAVRDAVLTQREAARFQGILGHYHVSETKVDPGPAFQWEYFLRSVRDQLERRPGNAQRP